MSDPRRCDISAMSESEPSCGVCAVDNPHFAAGERWLLANSLTFDSAASVLEASRAAALPKTGVIDLSRVEGVDSAALAVLLTWQRRAAAEGRLLTFVSVPPSLAALAELYGVQELVGRTPSHAF